MWEGENGRLSGRQKIMATEVELWIYGQGRHRSHRRGAEERTFPNRGCLGEARPTLPKFWVVLRCQRQVSNPVFPPRTQGSNCGYHLGCSISCTLDWVLKRQQENAAERYADREACDQIYSFHNCLSSTSRWCHRTECRYMDHLDWIWIPAKPLTINLELLFHIAAT